MSRTFGPVTMDVYKIVKYAHAPDRTWEWFEYSLAYLEAARHLTQEVKRQEEEGASDTYTVSSLLIPIIFNLRHGIELLLKLLATGTGDHLERTHNISSLCEKAKAIFKEVNSACLQPVAQALGLRLEIIRGGLVGNIDEIADIVRKYRGYSFLTDGKAEIDDEKNELFRYPTSTSSSYKLDTNELHQKIAADEIVEDLGRLTDFLWLVMLTFGRTTGGKTLLECFDQDSESRQASDAQ